MEANDFQFKCSELSTKVGEPMLGTASRCNLFFLLEYNDKWQPQAVEKSNLPEEVKAYLKRWENTFPYSKTLLIRRQRRDREKTRQFFIADANDQDPALFEYSLETYEELLNVDIGSVLDKKSSASANKSTKPIFLVCTHGTRDQCCAIYGAPVFQQAILSAPKRVWQSSHVGGHRFAANLLCLPHGVLYGRLTMQKTALIIEKYMSGDMDLEHLRGRSCYSPVAQAAESFIRQNMHFYGINDLHYVGENQSASDLWEVKFIQPKKAVKYDVRVEVGKLDQVIYESCGSPKTAQPATFRLIDFKAQAIQ